jgi:hypothetical protein
MGWKFEEIYSYIYEHESLLSSVVILPVVEENEENEIDFCFFRVSDGFC